MLINLSNHSSKYWSVEQLQAGAKYGTILHLDFPDVDPTGGRSYIDNLSDEYLLEVKKLAGKEKATIHIMGEMTFTFSLLKKLQQHGFECIASTSKRIVTEDNNGHKDVTFIFERFRKYC